MHVIVVGASGAVGASAARALARRGWRVTGLDRFEPGHDQGSSHGQSRAIRQAYFEHPTYVPMAVAAYAAWRELEREVGESLLHVCGILQLGPSEGEVIQGLRRAAAQHRLALEPIDVPGFPRPAGAVPLFERVGGWLSVEAGVRALAASAQAAGAELRTGVTVLGVDGSTVHTSAGSLTADRVVVAAGAWAPELLPLPLTVVRKVQLWFPTTRKGGPVFLHEVPEGVFYGFPAHEGRIKVAEHTGGEPLSRPLELDRSVHASDVERVAAFVRDHLPGVGTVPVAAAVCMYTMSPDGHFRIGSEGPVSWAAGLSGHGFKFAPVLGSVLADLVEGREPAFDLDPFASN